MHANHSRPQVPAAGDPTLVLGISGFTWPDLHEPRRLHDLLATFDAELRLSDPILATRYLAWRDARGEGLGPVETSAIITETAPHVSRFLVHLFGIERAAAELSQQVVAEDVVLRFKRDFLQKRVLQRFKSAASLGGQKFADLDGCVRSVADAGCPDLVTEADAERATATMVMRLFDLDRSFREATDKGSEPSSTSLAAAREFVSRLRAESRAVVSLAGLEGAEQALGAADPAPLVRLLVDLLERWSAARMYDEEGRRQIEGWVSYRRPETLDFQNLVQIRRPSEALPELTVGAGHARRRDGFKLTDRRMPRREVLAEVQYCIYCHERDKDSCAKGLHAADGATKKNPLGIELNGCPLGEKISEAHWLAGKGDPIAALATICIDNPLCPGTGHRICNDCMKSCIYQKQEPVNIPQIETRILTDTLAMPWGFELWGLLTRWNPLNPKRPVALPYNGKNVLVVGLGPAGYTLSHYLANEGFGVVAVDGLKIEHPPADLVGVAGQPPRALRDVGEIAVELDERPLAGFGGVSEYGITVRWDKNFLTMLHINLARRKTVKMYGGIRFGGTLSIDDAWTMGFDHVAIAAGAGKPTVLGMKNDLIRGIRTASDFLMALQLTGAFKRNALANLQAQLPAIVIGGGLTAIDTATELAAYYPLMVERTLDRHEQLEKELDADRLAGLYDEEEKQILATYLEHGRAVRGERARAAAAGELPDLARLVNDWGGVTIAYRKGMVDAPAYRLNHEEIAKAFEEGVRFAERLSPVEAVADRFGAVAALRFDKMAQVDGKWRASGQSVELPARSVFVAAGTSPNIIYEREHPGTFQLDRWNEFFHGHRVVRRDGRFELEKVDVEQKEIGFFTSYTKDGRFVSYYGDNHPYYAGNVVKAMASAKDGYSEVVQLFADQIANLDAASDASRFERFRDLSHRLDDAFLARVAAVNRLTPTIVEVVVRAPLAAQRFEPGQFFRLQNYEGSAVMVEGTPLLMEGLALTGAWVDPERGLLSMIVLEMGASSRLLAALKIGEEVVVMGPTGTPTEIPRNETVLLAGGGLGNAVLFSIGRALRQNGCKVVYFAGYKKGADLFRQDDVEASTDQVIWSVDSGTPIEARRPQDRAFVGNIVQSMLAYAEGRLGGEPMFPLPSVQRIIVIGSDRMMAAVKAARHAVLAPHLQASHVGIASINSIMQCMMKEVCGQCLQRHVDPVSGKESFVFSCFNQDQHIDHVDFKNLNDRLKTNSVLEKQASMWLEHLVRQHPLARV